ncbi:MAG: IS1634 family transposase [Symplocastrum torsivum CPER-KK1]|jgi:transposase|uniref:IS1634 family transposase n=1 Tax=Symplocastrum torsivum CPER-KK1 TaxID=450513 RepID=A0A951PNA1_9CYAN|nr:IS1634 family transposase [Symplocastrum torsivum CPER-KK1]
MSSVPEISVQNLDHLGLVAGLIDEIGIVEQINQLVGEKPGEIVSSPKTAPIPIRITYGYSRDHRPDLKQFILNLICSGDGDVPLFLRVASGNESDSAAFAQIFREFKKQLELDALMVADSALYTAPNIEQMASLRWLCRVPLTLSQAKQLIEQLNSKDFVESTIAGYRWAAHTSNYGGVRQRWLVVESESRRISDLRQLEKNITKAHQEAKKKLRELAAQEFACQPDALAAASRLSKQLKYHNLTQIQIVSVLCESESEANSFSRAESSQQVYKIQAQLEPDAGAIARQTLAAGRFILATNVLDLDQLSCDEMIAKYKEQQSSERGFAFLKDPLFFADSVFLKSPERIEALALVMGLCLLVYTLGQRYLRSQLQQSNSTLKNQLGQPTINPTLRWIFQCFQSVHFLRIATVKQISNLTQERLDILRFFPASCRAYYLLLSTS